MGDNTTPTDHESHPTSDAVYTDNESEIDDLNIEEESAFSEMDVSQKQSDTDLSEIDNASLNPSDTALSQMDDTSLNPSTNASTEAVRNSSSEVDSEYTGSSAPRLLINVSGTLETGLWHRRLNMEEGSGKPSILAKWRAGLNVKPIRRTNDELNEEGTLDVQEKEDHEPIEADTKETKLPSFITSVKDRMSIFRGKKTFKCLGKLFVNLHEKFIEECEKRDKIHRSYLDDRTIDERSLEKRKNMLKQARKEALIVNTEGKLFGRDVMALEKENPLTARIKAEVLRKYIAVSPMETKACSDKMPVQLFVRKVVEEHATVVFSRSSCIICIKLLTLLMDADIKHLSLRLDKMGGYGDSIYEFLRKEYTDNLPANVYFHESHPNFVKKSFSVVEQNSDSDAMVGLFPDTYDLIVIGGTSLGLQAVYEARKMDLKVCLIESPLVASATKPICLLGKSTLSEPDVSKKILYHLLSLRIRARKYQEEYYPDSNQKIHSDWAKLADSAQSLIAKICLQNVQSVHNVGGAFLKTGVKFVDHHTVE
ncbi:uncharacterized protein, partial [Halyomorpha halys]|uniref:uncharacterized protein n=1 Tax=Halyomorpha halys TaxID=286706 RepID=UPI0006D51A81